MADLQKPKRAANPYSLFNGHIREEVVNELKAKSSDGKAAFGDVARGVKAKWEALSPEEKKVWEDKAAAAKEASAEAIKAYVEAGGSMKNESKAAKNDKGEKSDKPKRAPSAYMLFNGHIRADCQREAEANAGSGKASFKEIAQLVSKKWEALSADDRKVWEDKSAVLKQEVEQAKRAWEEANDPAGALKAKYAHLIPKKPANIYVQWLQLPKVREEAEKKMTAEGKAIDYRSVNAVLAEKWKVLSAEEKAPLEAQHKKDMEQYEVLRKKWESTPEFKEVQAAQQAAKGAEKAEDSDEGDDDEEMTKPTPSKKQKV